MKNRVPAPPNGGKPIDFAPVPRKYRHDGWTPERQRAFIEALADTGSVHRAAAMVNMSPEGAYYLRRQPTAESFRAAWNAALDHGVQRMKDIAFERAVEGELIPILAGGKLIGYRRRYNDRLLMFCLRHYGQDSAGKRTTINYFSTRAVAGAAALPSPSGEGSGVGESTASIAEASTTTVRTTITGDPAAPLDPALLDQFHGVELDSEAQAEIGRVLAACAARRRAVAGTPDDPALAFLAVEQPERDILVYDEGYSKPRRVRGRPPPASGDVVAADAFLVTGPDASIEPTDQYRASDREMSWEMLDDEQGMARIEEAVASIEAAKAESESTEAKSTDGEADALT
jgi:hypothetical protein